MTVSIFEGCGEGCGYLAALIAIFAWGSFGVPLKFAKMQPSTVGHPPPEINFFVMQSYKTCMCFFTCWLVLLTGEKLRFSPWGLISGLFWVPGASCGIYGIRNAGLALAVGTWSSIQVLTSFLFGIIVFHEEVRSIQRATVAFLMLIMGLVGMASYAGMAQTGTTFPETHDIEHSLTLTERLIDSNSNSPVVASQLSGALPKDAPSRGPSQSPAPTVPGGVVRKSITNSGIVPMEMESSTEITGRPVTANNASEFAFDDEERVLRSTKSFAKDKRTRDFVFFGGGRFALSRRQMGILGAVVNGAWGGCALIPLHYAKRDHGLSGAGYLISFATGSMIVNTAMWILLFLYFYCSSSSKQPFRDAIGALPKWHLRELWWPGFLAGALYSIGNFCSILAVTYLGQATGFSICQLQLFISGLWGVVWFREIRTPSVIIRWFLSAACAICGIIWLSLEHKGSSVGGH